ncbi:MAG: hypothetical protein HRU14_15645, partial [Planctomycetes bacterium]|nr:hypothetical protein [Planctomycetota bacterium]
MVHGDADFERLAADDRLLGPDGVAAVLGLGDDDADDVCTLTEVRWAGDDECCVLSGLPGLTVPRSELERRAVARARLSSAAQLLGTMRESAALSRPYARARLAVGRPDAP